MTRSLPRDGSKQTAAWAESLPNRSRTLQAEAVVLPVLKELAKAQLNLVGLVCIQHRQGGITQTWVQQVILRVFRTALFQGFTKYQLQGVGIYHPEGVEARSLVVGKGLALSKDRVEEKAVGPRGSVVVGQAKVGAETMLQVNGGID
jgi:hypothetical protein